MDLFFGWSKITGGYRIFEGFLNVKLGFTGSVCFKCESLRRIGQCLVSILHMDRCEWLLVLGLPHSLLFLFMQWIGF